MDKIELADDWTALVTLTVNGDVDLPANAVAKIQQSSLLGEKFVELAAPGNEEAEGRPARATRASRWSGPTATSRSRSCSARSRWCSTAAASPSCRRSTGSSARRWRAASPRSAARSTELDTFIGGLDEQKSEINRALDSANALAATLAARTATIETALDTIGPGLDVINQQRDLLVSMLESLARLGDVGTRIINQSAADTVADLQLLQPILTQLAAAGPDLAGSLDLLLTYPFPASSVIGAGDGGSTPLNYRQDQRTGGYALFTNMTATVELDLTQTLCRYVIDPATGALERCSRRTSPASSAARPGTPPGNQGGTTGGGSSPAARSSACRASPGTSSARSPAPTTQTGLPGLPQLPGSPP